MKYKYDHYLNPFYTDSDDQQIGPYNNTLLSITILYKCNILSTII